MKPPSLRYNQMPFSHRGRPLTPSHREAIAEAQRARYEDPDERLKTAEATRDGIRRKETRKWI